MSADDHRVTELERRGRRRGAAAMADDVARAVERRRRTTKAVWTVSLLVLVAGAAAILTRPGDPATTDIDPAATSTPPSTTSNPAPTEFSGENSAADDVAPGLAAWNAAPIDSYFLRIEPECFCDSRAYLTEVVDGIAVASIIEADGTPHPAVADATRWRPTTVEGLYDLLDTYSQFSPDSPISSTGGSYELTLDESGRWPTRIALDPALDVSDDELTLDITLLTDRPAIFGSETVDVLILTERVLPGTSTRAMLDSVATTGVPAETRPANALDRESLEALEGRLTGRDISLGQIITADLFVDPAEWWGSDDWPDDAVAFSLRYEADHDFEVGDPVVVTEGQEEIEATILAVGRDSGTITLLVPNTDAQVLASATDLVLDRP